MRTAIALVALFLASPALAQDAAQDAPPPEDVAITVYSTADPAGFDPQQFIAQQRQGYNPNFAWQVPGYGVVKEVRRISLPNTSNIVRMTDVAEFIDPTTVSFVDLDHPDSTAVIQQAFKFDLVSPQKLLERYVDREIRYEYEVKAGVPFREITGRVLSVNQGQVVLQTEDGLQFIAANDPGIRLPALPGGLITRPTLEWTVLSEVQDQPHRVRTTYQTGGLTWRADYNLVLNPTDTSADVGAWVSLMNMSGASYPNARLKLVAGDVQRIQAPQPMTRRLRGALESMSDGGGFEEKSFFEYHLYTLPRRTDIPENTTQQIALFPTASDVGVEKLMVYYGLPESAYWGYSAQPHQDRNFGNQSNKKVDVYLRFENRQANKMGMPLPKGKVRVYKRDDADGTLEFIGEDLIDHTPRDETVMIRLGNAFDVIGERTQTDFKINVGGHVIEEAFEIQIRNHKDTAVKVIVKENLYRWSNWEILESSHPHEKADFRTMHIPVQVAAHGEQTVTYRVRYTW